MSRVIASLENASKKYKTGDTEIIALQPTTLEFNSEQLTLIIGPSGSGKTTLLSLLGCVIYPSSGKVLINGSYTSDLSEKQLAQLRLKNIGFVFQSINLVAPLTAIENVMLPLKLAGYNNKEIRSKAEDALKEVNMFDRRNFLPKQLSGGQAQRVAIARALVGKPPLLLCDEPTAALDTLSVETVMNEIKKLVNGDRAVAVVTHDHRLEKYADRIITVENGFATETPLSHL